MGYKTVYREVMRGYEAVREESEALLRKRREVLHESIPRIGEIDSAISALGLSLVKLTLAGNEQGIKEVKAEANKLERERYKLLEKEGIPEDYLTAVYRCQICKDTGYKSNEPGQLAQRCGCLKQRMIEAYYSLSNIKGVLKEENFDTFDDRYFSTDIIESEGLSPQINIQAIHRKATKFVHNFGTGFSNLLLYGATGLGKTFVCHCIAKDLLDAGFTVLYLTAPRMFKIIEDYRFNRDALDDPDEMLDAVTDVDLLVLDDLGAEFSTVVTSSALFDIVNQRLLAKKPTVISTNLSPSELERHYSERIVSRFTGYYEYIKFFGEDIREKKMYGG